MVHGRFVQRHADAIATAQREVRLQSHARAPAFAHAYEHARAYAPTHACIRTHTRVHARAGTHTHTHTHTQVHRHERIHGVVRPVGMRFCRDPTHSACRLSGLICDHLVEVCLDGQGGPRGILPHHSDRSCTSASAACFTSASLEMTTRLSLGRARPLAIVDLKLAKCHLWGRPSRPGPCAQPAPFSHAATTAKRATLSGIHCNVVQKPVRPLARSTAHRRRDSGVTRGGGQTATRRPRLSCRRPSDRGLAKPGATTGNLRRIKPRLRLLPEHWLLQCRARHPKYFCVEPRWGGRSALVKYVHGPALVAPTWRSNRRF